MFRKERSQHVRKTKSNSIQIKSNNKNRAGTKVPVLFFRKGLRRKPHFFAIRSAKVNRICRTFFSTFAAAGTFFIINRSEIICYVYSIIFALFLAELTADTACCADLLNSRSAVFVGAGDCIYSVIRNDFNQVLRTGCHAFCAGLAFAAVYDSYTVDDMDRIERTGFYAGAESETAMITGPRRKTAADCTGTVFDADVIALLNCFAAVSGAFDKCDMAFGFFCLYAHDLCDLFCNSRAAYRTAVYRCFALDDCGCHCITAGKAAGAAVVARQIASYRNFFFIHFYFKFFIHIDQQQTDQETDDADCCSSNKN